MNDHLQQTLALTVAKLGQSTQDAGYMLGLLATGKRPHPSAVDSLIERLESAARDLRKSQAKVDS